MGEPSGNDGRRHVVPFQGLLQQQPTPSEVTLEDRMARMGVCDVAPGVGHIAAQKHGCMLVLQAFEALTVHPREEKSDHHVVHDAFDELVNDAAQGLLTPKLGEIGRGVGLHAALIPQFGCDRTMGLTYGLGSGLGRCARTHQAKPGGLAYASFCSSI